MTLEQTIKELYESSIHLKIDTNSIGGVYVNFTNGMRIEYRVFPVEDICQITDWLKSTAIQLYPDSEFARRHK